ncbi:MAG TPA: DNA repair protein RecN [Clostridia bacterium]|nr:DNA repair protein RecN [Clostridia bacterium]
MLTTLRIKNLALAADLTLELEPGYNVITGETGAGKSMLIGALNLVLGERADRSLIRAGADQCSVEAVFKLGRLAKRIKPLLDEGGFEGDDGELLVKRTLTGAGTNRQFINGSPAPLSLLARLGELLVDIHGPHEHQSLLNPARQLDILDAFGKLEAEREAFSALVSRRAALEAEKHELVIDEKTYAQQLDLLRFQVQEIAAAHLQPDEQEQLEQDYTRASNSARLQQLAQSALEVFAESDANLLTLAGLVGRSLAELQRLDPSARQLGTLHEQVVSALRELQAALSQYADKMDLDPGRLEQLEERLNVIQSLKRKYGSNVAEIIAHGEAAASRLQALEQRETELERINAELQRMDQAIRRAGEELTKKRRRIIPQLARAATRQLLDLGFKQSRFDVAMETLDTGSPDRVGRVPHSGLDSVEFQFAPNPGEPAKPLRSIASSGELARVMLALKTVLAAEDQVPVLIFDEVDANVGGETAIVVGGKMRQIAQSRQVLCITHLPQVAAPAEAHFVVSKQVKNGRTTSDVALLERGERVTELARMLGGQSEAARKHAEALLEQRPGSGGARD